MHSQSALTEHASLNLAPLLLLDPVNNCTTFLAIVTILMADCEIMKCERHVSLQARSKRSGINKYISETFAFAEVFRLPTSSLC